MGKLTEKLQQVRQGSGGSLGFLSRGREQRAGRPAAIVVSLGAENAGAAESLVKAGADIVMVTGWRPGAKLDSVRAAVESAGAIWGVEYTSADGEEAAQAAQDAGASFIILGEAAPAMALFGDPEQIDRVLTLSVPRNEMDLLTLRLLNGLPANAAITTLPVRVAELARQSVEDFARLAILPESLRFPLLARVDAAPDAVSARALVRLGIDAIVLDGGASNLAAALPTLRADLEKIPEREGRRQGNVFVGGLMGSATPAERPEPDKRPDPDHE